MPATVTFTVTCYHMFASKRLRNHLLWQFSKFQVMLTWWLWRIQYRVLSYADIWLFLFHLILNNICMVKGCVFDYFQICFVGKTKAVKKNEHICKVLCRWSRHFALHRRGSTWSGHQRSRFDCTVWPSRWSKGRKQSLWWWRCFSCLFQ